ncbi:MAG: tripartite tricarboxylate transporter TctB family protein, partial [Betaproteobacteria bacterium]|nr:tripartite tricarboxylate transporter TctB family protein [Betaproteobacteria bacterium]
TAFAASLPYLGIVVAIVLLIWLAAPASYEFKVRDTLIATLVLLLLSYVVFVKGLELQFPFLPKFLDR